MPRIRALKATAASPLPVPSADLMIKPEDERSIRVLRLDDGSIRYAILQEPSGNLLAHIILRPEVAKHIADLTYSYL